MSEKQGDGVVKSKSRLSIVPRHQLIDLNKEYVNFEIFFECRSVDATKDFEMLVINQDQLNTLDLSNLVMKKTRGGYISGNIVADEDKYQNYFLVIKSVDEESMEADLEVSIRPIEPRRTVEEVAPPAPQADMDIFPPSAVVRKDWYDIMSKHPFHVLVALVFIALMIYAGYQLYKKYVANRTKDSILIDEDAVSIKSSSSSSSSSKSSVQLQDLISQSKQKTAK